MESEIRALVEAALAWRAADLADKEAERLKGKETFTAEYALASAVDILHAMLTPNEPMPWDAEETVWGSVPAGWFVRGPRDEWYEVLGTERVGGMQNVTLRLRDGKVGSWPRDPAGKVYAVAGTATKSLDLAIGNLVAAGFMPTVLQDPTE